jgi:integrase
MKNKNHHMFKRRDTWFFQKKVKGQEKPIKISLRTTSVVEARRRRNEKLEEIRRAGGYLPQEQKHPVPEFGELAVKWFDLRKAKLKKSTVKDYRNSLNNFILPKFGNIPIDQIKYLDIETFINELGCTNNRAINILCPMRSIFKLALKSEYIDRNPMNLLDPLKAEKPDINPFSMEDVKLFLENVDPFYRNFFVVAFFTGMRFGEMSALKWKNVDFRLLVIKVRETLVMGEEGNPKTQASIRDIDIKKFQMVVEAFREQRKATFGKSPYVFLNRYGNPVKPSSVRKHVWDKTIAKIGIEHRTMLQTRHTFITLMLDSGEHIGWIARQVGHTSPKMIFERYYSYIKNYQSDDGMKFMERVYSPIMEKVEKTTPNLPHHQKKGISSITNSL